MLLTNSRLFCRKGNQKCNATTVCRQGRFELHAGTCQTSLSSFPRDQCCLPEAALCGPALSWCSKVIAERRRQCSSRPTRRIACAPAVLSEQWRRQDLLR